MDQQWSWIPVEPDLYLGLDLGCHPAFRERKKPFRKPFKKPKPFKKEAVQKG